MSTHSMMQQYWNELQEFIVINITQINTEIFCNIFFLHVPLYIRILGCIIKIYVLYVLINIKTLSYCVLKSLEGDQKQNGVGAVPVIYFSFWKNHNIIMFSSRFYLTSIIALFGTTISPLFFYTTISKLRIWKVAPVEGGQ